MKTTAQLLAFTLSLGAAASAFAADQAAVLSPAARQKKIEAATAILNPVEVALPANLIDPFHPAAFAGVGSGAGAAASAAVSTESSEPVAPRGDQGLLQAIAAVLKPSGLFVIGGESTLAFGQKKVKAGSFLTVTFEGNSYTLEVTAIDRSTFTLRLNREEFTRPIK